MLQDFYLCRKFCSKSRANNYIETAIAAHRSFLNGSLPLEVQSESPSVVIAWFAFHFPSSSQFCGGIGTRTSLSADGGRLVSYKRWVCCPNCISDEAEKISLLVSSSRSAVAAGDEMIPPGVIIFQSSKQASFNVITWSTHGLTYAVVSSLPGSGRQSCMVCHQNMADGGHFSARQ